MSGTKRAHAPTWRAVRRAGTVQNAGAFLRGWLQIGGPASGARYGTGGAAQPWGRRGAGDGHERAGIAGRIRAEVAVDRG